jgi:polysaccharide deacetylase 2 family uncharacterized protein YibQ
VAEAPSAPVATDPAAETAPDRPALTEAATPPAAPAALAPPEADPAGLPEAATTPPAAVAKAPDSLADADPALPEEPAPAVERDEAAPEAAPAAETEAAPVPAVIAEAAPEAAPAPAPKAAVPGAMPEATAPDAAQAEAPAADPLPQADGMLPEADPPVLPGTGADPAVPEAGLPPDPTGPDSSDSTFESAPGLDATEGVIVGRLPRIGDAPAAEAPAGEAPDAGPPPDIRPIVRFATKFENPEAKPVMALVLIDPGTAELDRDGLAALPFPVSLALDPQDPATAERAALYRAAGKEVVMLATGIAEGAQASDIEVAFQSMAQGLPEAVAVMDLADPLFQDRRPLSSLVVPVVGAQGRGLLTWDRGLNAADQVARRNDVPAAVIFRDLGTAGPDSGAIRRVLDRAVFKAGQDGRVAVAGTATPELVAALLEWSVEGRAATVALAPLTAVLKVE